MLLPTKINRTVVRNAAYTAGGFGIRERHNERKNESYHNGDIDKSRADLNIHFRRHYLPDGTPETYEQTFKRMMEEGVIVQKGQKKDGTALVFDEMIFDVNTAYFEDNGGYDYAKSFFEEAYRCAVKEVGGEQYILSAILHADERNKALSEDMGRDIFHYHLHVVYVPIVEKEVLWSKRTKDKSLVGKVKEVIPQISHWKKWPQRVQVERDGKTITLNSYSLLQDRFFEHMRAAGFDGFERGERGSTREHLSDLEYKTMKENERLTEKKEQLAVVADKVQEQENTAVALDKVIQTKQQTVDTLSEKAEAKKKRLDELNEKTTVVKKSADVFADVDRMGEKRSMFGDNVQLNPDDWKTVSTLAKEGQKSRSIIQKLRDEIKKLLDKITGLEKRLEQYETKKLSISDTTMFYQARQRAPKRMADIIADIMRQPPEMPERLPERNKTKSKSEVR